MLDGLVLRACLNSPQVVFIAKNVLEQCGFASAEKSAKKGERQALIARCIFWERHGDVSSLKLARDA